MEEKEHLGKLKKLKHLNIVLLVGFCVDDHKSMIVMPHLDEDLCQLIKKNCKNPTFPQHVIIKHHFPNCNRHGIFT